MTYDVSVSRSDGYWVAEVTTDGDRIASAEVRRLAELEDMVRDLIPDRDSNLAWDYSPALGRDLHEDLADYRTNRAALTDYQRRYEQSQRKVAVGLRDAGVSVRDAAELLDLSFQRVQQLMSER